MPSAKAVLLAAAVTARLGGSTSTRLIQLTNFSSASSVNSDVLEAACDDALGLFRVKSGVEPDTDNHTHIAVLMSGVLYCLEMFKGANSGFLDMHSKSFFAGCKSINDRRYALPVSNSNLVASQDAVGARPDFDRSLNIFNRSTPPGSMPSEVED